MVQHTARACEPATRPRRSVALVDRSDLAKVREASLRDGSSGVVGLESELRRRSPHGCVDTLAEGQ